MHVKVNICWSPSGAGTRGREAGDTFVTQPRQVLSSENCGCLTRYLHIYLSRYLDIYTQHRLRSCTKNKRKPRHQLTASPAARQRGRSGRHCARVQIIRCANRGQTHCCYRGCRQEVLEPRASELIRTAGLHRDPRAPRDQRDQCDEARVYVTISTTLFCPDFWKHWRTAATTEVP